MGMQRYSLSVSVSELLEYRLLCFNINFKLQFWCSSQLKFDLELDNFVFQYKF